MTGRAREIRVRGAGVDLHAVAAGPASGQLVVLLHGFPETGATWRTHMGPLADAGFRVVAPDMRGYGRSDAPRGVDAYPLDRLVEDVIALADGLGAGRMVLVGHDWGGIVAWHLAATRPERVRRLVTINAPHLAAYRRELRTLDQMRRSWYVLYFQLPFLPELTLRARDFEAVERILRTDPMRPGAFDERDIEAHKAALAQPGALTAAVNYYRASLRRLGTLGGRQRRTVTAPTLVIWGERDRYLRPELTEGLERWVPDLRVERLPDASHWAMADDPERVNRLLADFLRGSRAPAAPG